MNIGLTIDPFVTFALLGATVVEYAAKIQRKIIFLTAQAPDVVTVNAVWIKVKGTRKGLTV